MLAFGFGHPARAQTPPQASDVRVFVGYQYQRANLMPTTLGALNGGAISLERGTPPDAASLVVDFRIGHRTGLYFGNCELCQSVPTTPHDRASNIQAILLAGVRESLPVQRARAFVDLLAGMGYQGWSSPDAFPPEGKATGSPLLEAGAGIDVPIRGRISARARASALVSNWDVDISEATHPGWREHMGLSAGVVWR